MILAHKIRLYPNNKQKTYFKKACGIKRFAYNWALDESKRLYEEGIKTSGYDLSKRLNLIKREEFPWMYEVTKWASQKAIFDSFDALKKWWNKKANPPRFKKKGKSKDSFYLGNASVKIKGKRVYIARLGWVRSAQDLRFEGRILSATVSQTAGMWFVSIFVEMENLESTKLINVVGVDVGIKCSHFRRRYF
jgi:putative transposase